MKCLRKLLLVSCILKDGTYCWGEVENKFFG